MTLKGLFIQYGCSIFLGLMAGMNAFCNAWSSYAIAMLKTDDSLGSQITQTVASLIASIPMLGSVIAAICAASLMDIIGRKKSLVLCGLLYTVAWSLIVSARSTVQILVARFIMGLSTGISSGLVAVYVSEITHYTIQGSTSVFGSLIYCCGILVSYLEGWFCSYNVIGYVTLTFMVIYVILLTFLKETPSYLLRIGKEKEALISLKFYRGESECTIAILEELSYLKHQVNSISQDADTEPMALSEKDNLNNKEKDNAMKKKNCWVLLFTVPHNRRAITSSITFTLLVGAMGIVPVQTYANDFFANAVPGLSPDLCSVIFALIVVAANLLAVAVTDLFPRRTLMMINCMISTVCLALIAATMHWPVIPSWVALVTVLLFCLVFHIGVINIIFAQLAECYGPHVKSAAAVSVFGSMFLANFVVVFLFAPAKEMIGLDGTFLIFSFIAGFTTILAYFWMKETRLVPLHEIEKMFDDGFMYKKVNVIES